MRESPILLGDRVFLNTGPTMTGSVAILVQPPSIALSRPRQKKMAGPQALCATSSSDSSSVSTLAVLSLEDTNTIAMNVSSYGASTCVSQDDQNTMTGAASIPTACHSSVDDDASSTRSTRSDDGRLKQIASTPSTAETTCSGSLEGELARLRELDRKRLILRHQRFCLEQRLSEFCGKHPEGSSPIASPGRAFRHVVDYAWQDSHSGLRVIYSGPLNEKNQPHGAQGRLQFADGQVYLGDVRNGIRAGHGRNTWPDGQDYVGEWKSNSRNGRGTHVWPDGRKVSGQWQDGHLHGKVYFSWPNGATYDGMVRKGKKHGRGELPKVLPIVNTIPPAKTHDGARFLSIQEFTHGTTDGCIVEVLKMENNMDLGL